MSQLSVYAIISKHPQVVDLIYKSGIQTSSRKGDTQGVPNYQLGWIINSLHWTYHSYDLDQTKQYKMCLAVVMIDKTITQ
jgi:hypothetical protein